MAIFCAVAACTPQGKPEDVNKDPNTEVTDPGTNPGEKPEDKPEITPDPDLYPMVYTELKLSPASALSMFQGEFASRNHKYMSGMDVIKGLAAIWDVEENTVSVVLGTEDGSLHAISDEGLAVGSFKEDEIAHAIFVNVDEMNYTVLDVPQGTTYSEAYCVSRDGSVIGGFFTQGQTKPCVWIGPGKKFVELPTPQSTENVTFSTQCEVRWMNEDASCLVGFTSAGKGNVWYYTLWERKGEDYVLSRTVFDFDFGAEGKEALSTQANEITAVSANGLFSPVSLYTSREENGERITENRLYRLRLQTGTFDRGPLAPVVTDEWGYSAAVQMLPTSIADDGTVVYCTSDFDNNREGFVWRRGSDEPVSISSFAGADALADYPQVVPTWIAPNCSSIAGFAMNKKRQLVSFILY